MSVELLAVRKWEAVTLLLWTGVAAAQSTSEAHSEHETVTAAESRNPSVLGLLGGAVVLLVLAKVTAVACCYGVWRYAAPLIMPRRPPSSDGPEEESVWARLLGFQGDTPEVNASGHLKYKGIVYAPVATECASAEDDEA